MAGSLAPSAMSRQRRQKRLVYRRPLIQVGRKDRHQFRYGRSSALSGHVYAGRLRRGETGLCRAKNANHTMMMNFMVYGVGMLAFC